MTAREARALPVELTDFSVYYSQGVAESITAELKEGKSEVVCEAGKLIKINKDKKGIITRVKVIDIFGNDTMTLVPVTVG